MVGRRSAADTSSPPPIRPSRTLLYGPSPARVSRVEGAEALCHVLELVGGACMGWHGMASALLAELSQGPGSRTPLRPAHAFMVPGNNTREFLPCSRAAGADCGTVKVGQCQQQRKLLHGGGCGGLGCCRVHAPVDDTNRQICKIDYPQKRGLEVSRPFWDLGCVPQACWKGWVYLLVPTFYDISSKVTIPKRSHAAAFDLPRPAVWGTPVDMTRSAGKSRVRRLNYQTTGA